MALQLHLGCGKRYIPGFIHVDEDDYPHIDHRHDICTLPMFRDRSADLIYACHVLEYFDRQEVVGVLKEWHRVLKPGGILRLAVPDFEALTQVYGDTHDLSLILGPLYGRMATKSPAGDKVIYHRTVYDFTQLKQLLESTGFTDVKRYDWRQTLHKDYDDFSQAYIPHMDKENGLLISLNVECVKFDRS
ncbi:MAG: methyltransferase domain-containing protein [Candidatus Omnitrophica bacterium]|nr:methyltransferase domain-containing protein [Candidatus Omnitrophota bacterium]